MKKRLYSYTLKNAFWAVFLLGMILLMTACPSGGGDSLPKTYTLGGVVSGLTGEVILTLNGSENLSVSQNGTFEFTTALEDGDSWVVSCDTWPSDYNIEITNGSGTISGASVATINVNLSLIPTEFTVNVTVEGLTDLGMVLVLNDDEEKTVTAAGPVEFTTKLAAGDAYEVKVAEHPSNQFCVIFNGRGTIGTADVENIRASCQTPTPIPDITSALSLSANTVYETEASITIESYESLSFEEGAVLVLSDGDNITADDRSTLTLAADSQIIAEDAYSDIVIGDNAEVIIGAGSQVVLGMDGDITVGTESSFTLEEGSVLELGDTGDIDIGDDSTVVFERDTVVKAGDSTDITVGAYASLEVRADSIIEIGDGASLTVESSGHFEADPGASFVFGSNADMWIKDYATFSIVGTEADPIVFTAEQESFGHWKGIRIGATDGLENVIDWAIVEYAGNSSDDAWREAALTFDGKDGVPTRVTVTNTVLRYSAGRGFYFNAYIDLENRIFDYNTVTGNRMYAGFIYPDYVRWMGENNDFSGNENETGDPVDYIYMSCYSTYDYYRVSTSQTWYDLGATYYVGSGSLNINANLTLEPGVKIEVDDNEGVVVNSTGTLNAVGTSEKPITFSGYTKTAGAWYGLAFDGSNTSTEAPNNLKYCIIEYGGGDSTSSWREGNLTVDDSSLASISHSIFRNSGRRGMYLTGSSSLEEFTGNTFTGNLDRPFLVEANLVREITGENNYTGNEDASGEPVDAIYVDVADLTVSQTWPNPGVPYFLDNDFYVEADWEIEAGSILEVNGGEGISIQDSGSLSAVGTVSDPIIFRGLEDTAGYWRGLAFDYSNAPTKNRLIYCQIEDGGGDYNEWNRASLSLQGDSALEEISNCRFANSLYYGLDIRDDSTIGTFSSNILTGNQLGAARSPADLVIKILDIESDYSGNLTASGSDTDQIFIYAGSSYPIGNAQTWPNLDVPYHIDGYLYVNDEWTIDPGTEFLFNVYNSEEDRAYSGITIQTQGVIIADGTESEPITFTRTGDAGYWCGLAFDNAVTTNNLLNYCEFTYGGGRDSNEFDRANISIRDGSTDVGVAITNCTLSSSAEYGISVYGEGVILNGETFGITQTVEDLRDNLVENGNTVSDNGTSNYLYYD